jgi:hypothetical protein
LPPALPPRLATRELGPRRRAQACAGVRRRAQACTGVRRHPTSTLILLRHPSVHQDDNAVVVWEAASGTAICGAPAFDDTGLTLRWLNNRNDRLVTAGNYHLRVWQVDVSLPKLHGVTAKMGNMRYPPPPLRLKACRRFANMPISTCAHAPQSGE